jgi:Tfp pilus assembly protein PilN
MKAVNLIPSEHRSRSAAAASQSDGAAYGVLGLVGGLAVLALLYGMAHHQIASRRSEAASLSARAQRASAEAAQLAPYTSFIALRDQRTAAVEQLVDSRFNWPHALYELGHVLPHDASISSLDGQIAASTTAAAPSAGASSSASAAGASSATAAGASGAPASAAAAVTSATPPGSVPTFTLSGCATSQAEVALTLERLRLIDGVSEVTLQSSTKAGSGATTGGSSGGCPGTDPAFTVQIAFAPLPSSTAGASSTSAVANTSGGAR